MYYPYFRGKQNELITIRDTANRLAESQFVPIIEPVKEDLSGLERALDKVVSAGCRSAVIVNPIHGKLASDGQAVTDLLKTKFTEKDNISAGIMLKGEMSLSDVSQYCVEHEGHPLTLIHAGFSDPQGLAQMLSDNKCDISTHVFFEANCGKLYQRHFRDAEQRVLIRDGFQRRRNREYPPVELFSDLHITYKDELMDGFGDFLIVGDEYSESGGPAHAVAIHLTYIDSDRDYAMYIHHFVSVRQDTPTDPAGKFMEALEKLVDVVNDPDSKVLATSAVKEFRDLHGRRHFPGLGYVKKLSMQHHIETLSHNASENPSA